MAEIPAPVVPAPRENDIFICYSPKNISFVKKLETAIKKQNHNPWIDLEDLPLGVDPTGLAARQYIEDGIREAEVFVFIISPDSVKSEKCRTELDLAVKCKKLLIPIVRRQVPADDVSEALQNIPWISTNLNDPTAFEELAKTIVHIHIHTQLLAKALEWQRKGSKEDLLLHKENLDSVEKWIEENEGKEPQFTSLQRQYVTASSAAYTKNTKPFQPDVFISYSRKDKEFVKNLCTALKEKGVNFWVDWDNIPAAANWRQEIYEGILASRTFLLIISCDSVASKYCQEEVARAAHDEKRMISIEWRRDYDHELLERKMNAIKVYNYISFDSFDSVLQKLQEAIRKDFEYVKFHTSLLLKAHEWNDNKRNADLLLRDGELKKAQRWLSDDRAKQPSPTLLQEDYIKASKDAENRQRLKALTFTFGISVFSAVAYLVIVNAKGAEVGALVSSLENNQGLDALIISLGAVNKVNDSIWGWAVAKIPGLKPRIVAALYKETYEVKERNRLEKHQERVYNVSFSRDGQLIASASQDRSIRLWKLDGTPVGPPLFGHQDGVVSIDFDPNDQILASASYDGDIKLWDLHSILNRTQKVTTINSSRGGHTDWVYVVRFRPDGRMLASASADGTVKIWTREGKLIKTLRHEQQVSSVSFSPNSQTLVSGSDDGIVRLWTQGDDFSKPKTLISKPKTPTHTSSVSWVNFSPDGQIIASADIGGTIKLWRRDGTQIPTSMRHEGIVHRVEFSADGQVLASASEDKTVKLWSRDGTLLHTLLGHEGAVYRVQFSHDGQTVATAGVDGTIKLWRQNDGTVLDNLEGHRDEVLSINFSPDDRTLVSASADKTVRLWNLYSSDRPFPLVQSLPHDNRVYDVSFRSDGRVIASSGVNSIKLWRSDGIPILPIENAHKGDVLSISFNPKKDDMMASAGADGDVKLWQLFSGSRMSRTLLSYSKPISNLSFSGDGKMLASASEDGTLQLFWRLNSPSTKPLTFPAHEEAVSSISFSPKNLLLASATKASKTGNTSGEIKLWKIDNTGVKPLVFYEARVIGDKGDVSSVSFSPDGQLLASAGADKTVKLWQVVHPTNETANLQFIKSFPEKHTAPLTKVVFSPNGRLLASASQDGTVNIWTKEGDLITTLVKHHRLVSSVRFSPDSKIHSLVSVSYDGSALVWRAPKGFDNNLLDQLRPYGCRLLQDYLKTGQSADSTKEEDRRRVKDSCLVP